MYATDTLQTMSTDPFNTCDKASKHNYVLKKIFWLSKINQNDLDKFEIDFNSFPEKAPMHEFSTVLLYMQFNSNQKLHSLYN